jgi:hypothetical protein
MKEKSVMSDLEQKTNDPGSVITIDGLRERYTHNAHQWATVLNPPLADPESRMGGLAFVATLTNESKENRVGQTDQVFTEFQANMHARIKVALCFDDKRRNKKILFRLDVLDFGEIMNFAIRYQGIAYPHLRREKKHVWLSGRQAIFHMKKAYDNRSAHRTRSMAGLDINAEKTVMGWTFKRSDFEYTLCRFLLLLCFHGQFWSKEKGENYTSANYVAVAKCVEQVCLSLETVR